MTTISATNAPVPEQNQLEQKYRTYAMLSGLTDPALQSSIQKFAELLTADYDKLMNQLNTGERIIVPKTSLHAKNLRKVAQDYLDKHGDDDPTVTHTIESK